MGGLRAHGRFFLAGVIGWDSSVGKITAAYPEKHLLRALSRISSTTAGAYVCISLDPPHLPGSGTGPIGQRWRPAKRKSRNHQALPTPLRRGKHPIYDFVHRTTASSVVQGCTIHFGSAGNTSQLWSAAVIQFFYRTPASWYNAYI